MLPLSIQLNMQQLRRSRSSATHPARNTAKPRAGGGRGWNRRGDHVIAGERSSLCQLLWQSSACCCNSLLLTQHQTPLYARTLTPKTHVNAPLVWKTSLPRPATSVPPSDHPPSRSSHSLGLSCPQTRRRCSSRSDGSVLSSLSPYPPSSWALLWFSAARSRRTGGQMKCVVDRNQQESDLVFK